MSSGVTAQAVDGLLWTVQKSRVDVLRKRMKVLSVIHAETTWTRTSFGLV